MELRLLSFREEEVGRRVVQRERKRGRPVKDLLPIPKSKKKEISLNTSAYSQARDRIDLGIIKKVFERTAIDTNNKQRKWKGHPIFITDGTYLTLQDTVAFRKVYTSGKEYDKKLPYPKMMLQVIIQQGTGKIHAMSKSPWNCSEIKLFAEMIDTIPSGGIVIADALYNGYHLFDSMMSRGVSFIISDKKRKHFKVIREISPNESIIEIKSTQSPKWFKGDAAKAMRLRRIEWSLDDSEKGTMVLLTDLLDEKQYPTAEIIGHYLTRWDIEICFREIKKIMEIDILRGKTEEMIQKELYIALSAYNLVREIISESTQEGTFPPYEDFFQKVYQGDKKLLVDKVGRVYVRWSTGRYGVSEKKIKEVDEHTSPKSSL